MPWRDSQVSCWQVPAGKPQYASVGIEESRPWTTVYRSPAVARLEWLCQSCQKKTSGICPARPS